MISIDFRPAITTPTARSAPCWRVRAAVTALSAVAVATLAGCGSSSSKASTPAPAMPAGMSSMATGMSSMAPASSAPAAEPITLTIDKFAYSVPASVSPGAKITVQNKDGDNHTVTADSGGGFDVKADGGASTVFTAPMTPGSYPFHCVYHSNMHGVLVVK